MTSGCRAPILGINHLTLAVSDLERSIRFYRDGLGLILRKQWSGGAHFEAGKDWICLSLDDETVPTTDYTHHAFSVAAKDFPAAKDRLRAHGARAWKQNRSEGNSFYFLDPDGRKLELHVGSLASRLAAMESDPKA